MEPGTGNGDHAHRMSSRQFTLPRLERVISGPGSVERLAAELDRYGCTRVVVVTGKTLAVSRTLSRISTLLGSRCVSVFDGARQHVPSRSVDALVTSVRQHRADCLVSVGGGSPIDTAKAAVHALIGEAGESPLVHIAIPTTLSAGEFTDVAGITDETTRVKRAVYDVRLAPRTVIADPEVTLDTPEWLWAASGIRALDHAVETLYASRVHPISEPLAIRAIEMLLEHLPRAVDDIPPVRRGRPSGPPDTALAHRAECQMAAWLAVFGVTNAGFGLSHVLGHQIGPRWNVAHGVTSAIVLPHAMRFMAAHAPDRFRPIAQGFGIAFDGRDPGQAASACAARAAAFIAQFNLPARLRDVGVPEGKMGEIAAHVCEVLGDSRVIDRPIERADLMSILTSAC